MFSNLRSTFALVAALPALLLNTVFPPGPSVLDLQNKYKNDQVSVLIVPGHDLRYSGAVYKGIKEADLTLAIAYEVAALLKSDPRLDIRVSREKDGSYSPWLLEYIEERGREIVEWRTDARVKGEKLIADGSFIPFVGVPHNNAPGDVATYLYSINHYANNNDIDIVIHLHINDEPRVVISRPGKSTGYSIYVPEPQLSGSVSARAIATSLAAEFDQTAATSTLKQESVGVVDEQELVAVGRWGTRTGPSLLVEYGYIYEPKFTNATLRKKTIKELGFQTYVGLERFFNPQFSTSSPYSK